MQDRPVPARCGCRPFAPPGRCALTPLLAAGLLAWAVVAVAAGGSAAAAVRPRLVVVVSIDQFPHEYLYRMRQGFSPDGIFLRMTREGAWYDNCHHGHAFTLTAPGHSVLLSGAYPNTNGIIHNHWYDRRVGADVYCVADPLFPLVGGQGSEKGISPKTLLVGTLGDTLKLAYPQAKVYGVSLKDRAAVLMTGHLADGAYWFEPASGNWVTSTYYHKLLPGYLRVVNDGDAAEAWADKSWELLLPRERYAEFPHNGQAQQPDSLPEPKAPFRHRLPAANDPKYYEAMTLTPFGNDLTLAVARLVLTSERLGADDVPDILAINLSSNDYVGHKYGPHSLEVQDIAFRTDRQLGEFAAYVEQALGGAPWLMVLTSDHGVAPVPEYAAQRGLPAGRDSPGDLKQLAQQLEGVLHAHLGAPSEGRRYVQHVGDNNVYLYRDIPELRAEKYHVAQRVVRDALLELPAVAHAFTREDLMAGTAWEGLAVQFQRAFHPQRSGEVLYALRPYYISGKSTATHGSPWEYDSHVPLLVWGSGVRAGRYSRPVTPAQIAPTLSRILHIAAPSSCSVDPLDEVLDWRE